MNSFIRGILLSLGVFVLPSSISSASAEPAQATRTILAEDEKVQVSEVRQKPGEINTPSTNSTRVIRALHGGTLLRTYADGKTEQYDWKTGEVQIQPPGPQYTIKNVGKSEVVLYIVRLK